MTTSWVLMYWILWANGGFIVSGDVGFFSQEACEAALVRFSAQYMAYSNVEHGGVCVRR